MRNLPTIHRRNFAAIVAGLAGSVVLPETAVRAAAPDGAGAITGMIAALQAARALSVTVDMDFGASVARDKLKTLGKRASIVFQRPESLFMVFGEGGQPDVQMLIEGDEATLFRLSLGAKTTVKIVPENGAAFAVPGLFVPVLGLLSEDIGRDFFGGLGSVTPIAQGAPDQPEPSILASVLGGRFTGEIWVDRSSALLTRVTGTWFGNQGDMAASAVVNFSGWSTEAPVAGAFAVKGLAEAKSVELDALGL